MKDALQEAKALFSDFSKQSYKNEAKEKFIRIQSNGWFLFRKKNFTINKDRNRK